MLHQFYYLQSGVAGVSTFRLPVERQYPDQKRTGFPLASGMWFAEDAPGPSNHHTRALFTFPQPVYDPKQNAYLLGNNPQRYAIDFASMVNGVPFRNAGDKNEDWYCYNQPVLAAEEGTVVFTENRIPDNLTPGKLDYSINLTNVTGNVVYIEHSDGTLSIYAHLIPNSLVVQVGQTVKAGQVICRLGNSGNSSAPHLHFHIVANPEKKKLVTYTDGLFLEGIPYSFPAFRKLGTAPDNFLTQLPPPVFTPTLSQPFTQVIPFEDDVITF